MNNGNHKRQYEIYEEIYQIIEQKHEMAPLTSIGEGWFLYNFTSYGLNGKINKPHLDLSEKEIVLEDLEIKKIGLELEEDPSMTPTPDVPKVFWEYPKIQLMSDKIAFDQWIQWLRTMKDTEGETGQERKEK